MLYLIVALIVLGIFSAILGLLSHNKKGESSVILADSSSCSTCNGDDPKCEQLCMMEAATREIEYFDDEELDRFRGTPADAYTEEQADEFRNILYTMREVEVAAWVRSLQLRAVELPDQLKPEVFLIVSERRQ